MKKNILIILIFLGYNTLFAQEQKPPKFYIGLSYGSAIAVENFSDKDVNNENVGFATNG